MSKNGSRTASKYSGRLWTPVGSASNTSKFFKPPNGKKKKKSRSRTRDDFEKLCKLFETEISLQTESLKLFRRISPEIRPLALSKVEFYKAYCSYVNQPFRLKNYLLEKPYLKRGKKKKKQKRKKYRNYQPISKRKSKSNSIGENIDEATLKLLKKLKHNK